MMTNFSLKTRFTFFIALIYLLLGGITFAAIHVSTQRIINLLGTRFAVKQALLEKEKFLSHIQHDLTLSLKLAHSPFLQDWVANEQDGILKQRAVEELESYRSSLRSKTLFLAIGRSGHYYFADGRKDEFAHPRYTLHPDNPNDAWFYRTMHGIDTFELNIDYDNHLKLNKLWMNIVIRNRQGKKIGLCGSGIDITRFINEIVNVKEPGINTVLLDTNGVIEGYKDRRYVVHNSKVRGTEKKFTIYDLLKSSADKNVIRNAIHRLTGGNSTVESFSLRMKGKKYIAAVAYIGEIHWVNLVLIDPVKVIGANIFLPFVGISVFSLLLVIVFVAVLLNRLVLKQLVVLSDSANEMAAGNFDISVPVRSGDEIGKLTDAFNQMAAMVKDHSENLEQKVVQRTEELQLLTEKLSESNKKIMDSIRYAQLIQASILPPEETLSGHMQDYFILYKPRDIVGGDFYFFREIEDGFIIAVADCTGHGVPGAFMTMTTNAVLSHIIDGAGIYSPDEVLQALHRNLHGLLHRNTDDEFIDYGLDIGLCRYIYSTDELFFAGAGIDLYLVAETKVEIIAGDRSSLGYRKTGLETRYNVSCVSHRPGMQFYLISDGILDQSGGTKGWGFGRKRFAQLIQNLDGMSASEQRQKIEKELRLYQGNASQRDDITVVGFRPLADKKDLEDR